MIDKTGGCYSGFSINSMFKIRFCKNNFSYKILNLNFLLL